MIILIWDKDHFCLHYSDWWENLWQDIQNVNIYDLFWNGKPDLLISVNEIKDMAGLSTNIYLKILQPVFPGIAKNQLVGFSLLKICLSRLYFSLDDLVN